MFYATRISLSGKDARNLFYSFKDNREIKYTAEVQRVWLEKWLSHKKDAGGIFEKLGNEEENEEESNNLLSSATREYLSAGNASLKLSAVSPEEMYIRDAILFFEKALDFNLKCNVLNEEIITDIGLKILDLEKRL